MLKKKLQLPVLSYQGQLRSRISQGHTHTIHHHTHRPWGSLESPMNLMSPDAAHVLGPRHPDLCLLKRLILCLYDLLLMPFVGKLVTFFCDQRTYIGLQISSSNPDRRLKKSSERQLSFSPQFSIARIVGSSICLQQQNKPLFSSDVCFSPQPDPITSRRHLLLINTKSQINEHRTRAVLQGVQRRLLLRRFPSILITALMKRLLSVGHP